MKRDENTRIGPMAINNTWTNMYTAYEKMKTFVNTCTLSLLLIILSKFIADKIPGSCSFYQIFESVL